MTSRLLQVLIINDDPQQRDRIRKVIEGLCEITAPQSHRELTVALNQDLSSYALVILDYELTFWDPKEYPRNGAEILQRLRPKKEDRQPSILLLEVIS